MKIYLSGPMKGYPQSNYPLFNRVAARLRIAGHDVYNPAEFPHIGPFETFPLRQAFAAYCRFICLEADAIVLLPGWEKSLGVSAELALAKNCKLDVIEWGTAQAGETLGAETEGLGSRASDGEAGTPETLSHLRAENANLRDRVREAEGAAASEHTYRLMAERAAERWQHRYEDLCNGPNG